MSYKLFVGSLDWGVTDDDLKDFFSTLGEVESATVIKDRDSGRSRGFGFVEYADEEAGKKAIDELNGKELKGRQISVSEPRPKEDRPRRDFGGNSNRY